MHLTGENLIGLSRRKGEGSSFRAFDPARQQDGPTDYHAATARDLDEACTLADAAAVTLADVPRQQRAAFLDGIANRLGEYESLVVRTAMQETGLPEARLKGELARTANQLRLFARVVREGAFLDLRVDPALPGRAPPRPDLRVIMRPLGPVAVFGASNFPLAFSVAGGDTASAFAAGCPVIVKAHHAHPGTSEIVGLVIQDCVRESGLPEGTFSLLYGSGADIGQGLVADPRIRAVGFTGSRSGGTALCATAARRKQPIPVYAEMSSINPVLLLPDALAARAEAIGSAFAAAQTMGAGQFCTNPGLLLAIDGPDIARFTGAVGNAYAATAPGTMLTPGIHQAYCSGVARLRAHPAVSVLVQGAAGEGLAGQPVLMGVRAADFLADATLAEEVFGSASLLVTCASEGELGQVLASLEGQLTAAVHAGAGDAARVAQLLPLLERLAGRVLFDGFGTGVEVCDAMVHGGPSPATSDVRTTSVGSLAIQRFLRPVCYQDVPQQFLPADLRDGHFGKVVHRYDGAMVHP